MNTQSFINQKHLKKRNIAIFGFDEAGRRMYELLSKYHRVECFVDLIDTEVQETGIGVAVHALDFLRGKKGDFYVIIPSREYDPSIEDSLWEMGFTPVEDYLWIGQNMIEPDLEDGGEYRDDFGNYASVKNGKGLRLLLRGGNNVFVAGESAWFLSGARVELSNGADIRIESCTVSGPCGIKSDGCVVEMRNHVQLGACSIEVSKNSVVTLDNTTLLDGTALSIKDSTEYHAKGSVIGSRWSIRKRSCASVIGSKCLSAVDISGQGRLELVGTSVSKESWIFVKHMANVCMRGCVLNGNVQVKAYTNGTLELRDTTVTLGGPIQVNNNSEARISGCRLESIYVIGVENFGKLEMEKTWLKNGAEVRVVYSSVVKMEKNGEFNPGCHIVANHGSQILIKEDCGVSWNVWILSGGAHPIFDLHDLKRFQAGSVIEIGRHVWLGESCSLLNGTVIGDGCIVAAGSVTGTRYPNNCMIMGYPARAVKRDVAFDLIEANPERIDPEIFKPTGKE